MPDNNEVLLSELANRFLYSMDYIQVTGYKLKQNGIINNEATLTKIKKGVQQPSRKMLDKYIECYAEINPVWLLTGKGKMLNPGRQSSGENVNHPNEAVSRIRQIINDKFNGSIPEFCEKLNLFQATVKTMLERNIPPSHDIVMTIIDDESLNINVEWLMTGKGEPYKEYGIDNSTGDEKEIEENRGFTTYLLPMSAMGGSLTGFAAQGVTLQYCEAVVSPIENVDFAITVYGESMAPEYPSGSRILIKRINPDIFIDWGKVFVLDTSNGVVVKEVRESNIEGYVSCYSINPDPKFKPFDISMSEVFGMYRVLMCLSAK